MNLKNQNLIRFLGYVKPYTKYLILAVFGGIIKFSFPLLVPQVIRYLIDHVFLNNNISYQEKFYELFLLTGSLAFLFLFIYSPFVYIRHLFSQKASYKAVFDLRCELYYRILRLSTSFFNKNKTGEIVSRMMSDVTLAQNLVGTALTNIWMDGISLTIIIFFLYRIDPVTASITLLIFPIYIYFFKKFRIRIRSATSKIQNEMASMTGNISETISASNVVHAFGGEKKESEFFNTKSDKLFTTHLKRGRIQSLNQTVTGLLTNIAPIVVFVVGGIRVLKGSITVGELTAIVLYLNPLYLPMQRFSELNVVLANSLAALERIFYIIDLKPEITSKPNAIMPESIKGEIEFYHVSFEYEKGSPILKDICFKSYPGKQTAIAGPSGSGKTTILNLLPRFFDVTKGKILIDGIDIRDLELNFLRRQIGIVLQDPILFSGSIYENILYGNPDATEHEIIEAAKSANAYNFVLKLSDGFDTQVGEKGDLLSGGQKQRITIARAFLKDPKILIMDEATSSLDSQSERIIQEALDRLIKNRTTFIVAHRLSTIIQADHILVMDKGNIIEQGIHSELIQMEGLYRSLYYSQLSNQLESFLLE